MKLLKISNRGEICKSAFVLMGASSKRDDDTKIGYFGTGIKYAIATLIRIGAPVMIYSGLDNIKIEKVSEEMRGKTYETLVIGGRQTSVTTEMGINWKPWQAIREIYCNAVDEDESNIMVVDAPDQGIDFLMGEEGKTVFYIGVTDEIKHVIDNWDDYFSNNRKDVVLDTPGFKVFYGRGKISLYRKGIRCYDSEVDSIYDYDLDDVAINEARIAESIYTVKRHIGKFWQERANSEMVRTLFDKCDKEKFEYGLEWLRHNDFNAAWKEVIGDRKIVPNSVAGYFPNELRDNTAVAMCGSLVRALDGFYKGEVRVAGRSDDFGDYLIVDPSPKQSFLIKEVMSFFEEVGFEINWPIKVAFFKEKKILGKAAYKEIIISSTTFDLGKKMLAATILEETFHLESQCADETRGFQDFLINKLLTLLEEKNGLFL